MAQMVVVIIENSSQFATHVYSEINLEIVFENQVTLTVKVAKELHSSITTCEVGLIEEDEDYGKLLSLMHLVEKVRLPVVNLRQKVYYASIYCLHYDV